MWSSVFTILVAVFDLCALMKHVTMFSEDGFTKIDGSVAGSDCLGPSRFGCKVPLENLFLVSQIERLVVKSWRGRAGLGAWGASITAHVVVQRYECNYFSQDIFAGLISLIFIIDGILPILRNFIEETIPLRSAMFETLLFVITFGGLAVRCPGSRWPKPELTPRRRVLPLVLPPYPVDRPLPSLLGR